MASWDSSLPLVPWYEDTKIFTPYPQKIDFWPKNRLIWPKTGYFGQISAFFAHFIQCPTKKQFRQVAQVVPRWVQKLLLTPTRIRNFGQKAAIFGKNWFFWPIIGIFGPFGLMPNQKTMQKRCCGAFPLCWYQNFWFLSQKFEFWPKNGPILPKTWILVKYWSLGSIWFQARPIKQCKRGAQGTLSWEKTVVF